MQPLLALALSSLGCAKRGWARLPRVARGQSSAVQCRTFKRAYRFPRVVHASKLGRVVGTLMCLFAALAQADSLDGTWKASPLRVSWSVGDWGSDCGPRPSGGGEPATTFTLTSTASGFTLSGGGRTYSTGQCWEQMPGLAARSRSAGGSVMQTTCTMPPGDPRHAKVTTSWYPDGEKIVFDEVGQYRYVIGSSTCTASVRRTRTLTRTARLPTSNATQASKKPAAAPLQTPSPLAGYLRTSLNDPPPPPERAPLCAQLGPPVRLEVVPRTKLMRPGESFHFVATARDAKGCRVPVATSWKLTRPSNDVTLSSAGELQASAQAHGARVEIEASVANQSVKVSALVVSQEEFNQLLAAGTYGTLGESLDSAELTLATDHVELDSPGAAPTRGPSILLWLLGLLSALVAGATVLLVRRRNQHQGEIAAENQRDSVVIEARPTPPPISIAPPPAPSPTRRTCPVCGKRYEEGTMYCTDDGARLMRAN